MLPQTRHKASIHPSIDGLVKLIGSTKESSPDSAALRELCRGKIRSYREDVYLKRFIDPADQQAARDRWQVVAAFANRNP